MSTYTLGNEVTLRLTTARGTTGAAVDPDVVTLHVQPPGSEAVRVYTYPGDVTRDALGNYSYTILGALAGAWRYRWSGTGVATGACEGGFLIAPSNL